MAKLHRLDRANFGGPLTQGKLFKALRKPRDGWISYEVQPADETDLYRISWSVYGTVEAWWVAAVCAGMENPMDKLPAGIVLTLPPLSWLREQLKRPGRTIED